MTKEEPYFTAYARMLSDRADEEFHNGNFIAAIELFTKSLGVQRSPDVYAERGRLFLYLQQLSRALSDCYECLAINNNHYSLLFLRAKVRHQLEQADLALLDLERLLELYPESIEDHDFISLRSALEKQTLRDVETDAEGKGDEFTEDKLVSVPFKACIIGGKSIENGSDEESQLIDGATKEMALRCSDNEMNSLAPVMSLPSPARSYPLFACHFDLLKHSPVHFAEYFQTIPIAKISPLLSTVIHHDHVACLLKGFHERLRTGATTRSAVLDSLSALIRIDRFDIAVAFLSPEEIHIANEVVRMLQEPRIERIKSAFSLCLPFPSNP